MKLFGLFLACAALGFAEDAKKEEGCGCDRNYLIKTDFTNYNLPIILDGPNANWLYFGNPAVGFIANGGTLSPGKHGAIQDSSTFYRYWPQSPFPELPRVQFAIFDKDPIPIVEKRKTTFAFKMGSEILPSEKNPYPVDILSGPNDYRLGSAGPFILDLTTNVIFEYLLTNDRIYAGYSRLSLGLFDSPYAGFEYFIPLGKTCPGKMHDLDIIVNSVDKTVSFKVDGKVLLTIGRVGFRLPSRQFMVKDLSGPEVDVFPQALWYGFGAYTFMDAYPTCGNGVVCPQNITALSQSQNNLGPQAYDPKVGPPTIASYWDNAGLNAYWLWGQGSRSTIKEIEVYYRNLF